MSVGTIFIGLAMLVISVPLVAKPILEKRRSGQPEAETAVAKSYQAILLALRDLELDHQTGVVTDDDYAQLQAQLMAEAAAALADEERSAATSLDVQIETAVSAFRRNPYQERAIAACVQCGATLSTGDKFCAQCGAPSLACPQCQQVHDPQDKFCSACGHPLTNLAGAAT